MAPRAPKASPETGLLLHPRGELFLLISPGRGTLWAPGSYPSGWAPGPPACLSQKAPLPLPEFLEDNPVWEALAADADALQNPVAPQLLQHQVGVQLPCLEETKEGVTLPNGEERRRRKGGRCRWGPLVPGVLRGAKTPTQQYP